MKNWGAVSAGFMLVAMTGPVAAYEVTDFVAGPYQFVPFVSSELKVVEGRLEDGMCVMDDSLTVSSTLEPGMQALSVLRGVHPTDDCVVLKEEGVAYTAALGAAGYLTGPQAASGPTDPITDPVTDVIEVREVGSLTRAVGGLIGVAQGTVEGSAYVQAEYHVANYHVVTPLIPVAGTVLDMAGMSLYSVFQSATGACFLRDKNGHGTATGYTEVGAYGKGQFGWEPQAGSLGVTNRAQCGRFGKAIATGKITVANTEPEPLLYTCGEDTGETPAISMNLRTEVDGVLREGGTVEYVCEHSHTLTYKNTRECLPWTVYNAGTCSNTINIEI